MQKGKTFIISGPSGVGKSTVLHELFKGRDDLYFSISATTRDPREGEVDGVHYHFIDVQHFQELIEADALLEYAEYVGNFYGTPKKYVDKAMNEGRDVILDIEVQGALQVCTKRPETHLHRAAVVGRAGAPSYQPRDRQPRQDPKAPAAGKDRAAHRGRVRLLCHQRYGGAGCARDQCHYDRRALQARRPDENIE